MIEVHELLEIVEENVEFVLFFRFSVVPVDSQNGVGWECEAITNIIF